MLMPQAGFPGWRADQCGRWLTPVPVPSFNRLDILGEGRPFKGHPARIAASNRGPSRGSSLFPPVPVAGGDVCSHRAASVSPPWRCRHARQARLRLPKLDRARSDPARLDQVQFVRGVPDGVPRLLPAASVQRQRQLNGARQRWQRPAEFDLSLPGGTPLLVPLAGCAGRFDKREGVGDHLFRMRHDHLQCSCFVLS